MEMFEIIFVKLCVLQTEQGEDAGICNAASLAPAMSKSWEIAFSVEVLHIVGNNVRNIGRPIAVV